MSEHSQHDPNAGKAGASPARKLTCEEWEAMLVDFLDGTLAAGDPSSFHAHRESCAACAEMFTQAGQGREWLSFLRVEPEAPSTLVGRILAQTSGTEPRPGINGDLIPAPVAIPVAPVPPFWKRGGVAFAGRQMAQPRLLMTAAMAFFSITLTLNMAGVRLTTIRMADLNPSALSSNLNKQYHTTSARVVRYYDNLRFVYDDGSAGAGDAAKLRHQQPGSWREAGAEHPRAYAAGWRAQERWEVPGTGESSKPGAT